MNKTHQILIASGFLLMACASTGKNFSRVYPGMSQPEVNKVMGKAPSKVEPFSDNYAAWYYDENHCLLLKDEKVLSKAQSEEKGSLEIFGLGGAGLKRLAQCLPPGQTQKEKVQRKIETPFGNFRH